MRVGFVGLGLMGSPMAMHLIKAGLEVALYNRSAEKAGPHAAAGAVVCGTPADLGGRCSVVLICVSDTEAVESVIFFAEGLAETMARGQLIKLCNNLVGSLHVLALAEGFHFAKELGLDLKLTHQVIASGAAGSFIWENWGGKLVEGDLGPGFKIALHRKDIRLVLDECQRVGLELPGLQLAAKMYDKALDMGLGELGDQAMVRVLEERPGGGE